MTTLKISDLSVGDWVSFDTAHLTVEGDDIATAFVKKVQQSARIKSISGDQDLIFAEVETEDNFYTIYLKMEHIRPIPITAEILEKNGFTRLSGEFPIYGYITLLGKVLRTIQVRLDHPYSYIVCRFEDTSKELHEFNRTLANLSVDRSPIHIHDLQHALHLVGADKEIYL